jgi:hypothetical protein
MRRFHAVTGQHYGAIMGAKPPKFASATLIGKYKPGKNNLLNNDDKESINDEIIKFQRTTQRRWH